MRYYSAWTAAGLLAAIALGCGPGKELPEDITHSRGTEQTPKKKIPTESDPVAREIVDRAIKAHTQNNPGALAKAKISKMTANGFVKLPSEGSGHFVDVPTFQTVMASWPDRLKFTQEYREHRSGTMTMILRGPFTWCGMGRTQNPNSNPQETENMMRKHGLGQYWLPLVFPLADSQSVVFEPRKGLGTPPADVVRFALPDRPVYQLSFDPATGYLTRIEYTSNDFDIHEHRFWVLTEHKPFDGLILPTKMELTLTRANIRGEIVERWAVDKWEFPEKLDDGAFEPPK